MANVLYSKAKEALLTGAISWTSDNIKAVLVDTGAYTPSVTTNQFLTDIPSAARIATSGSLTGKSATDGVADAADITFPLATGPSVEAIVLYKDTGSPSSSRLIAYIDAAQGLPITPNGGDIVVQWSNSANRIIAL
ncbi:hypothetical protein [Tsukamurella spumae]|uniref:Uncharacterized protein n=1 Tax=Tsukamurella spumae TaxID=44753 RepID=A0A846X2V7_9ACTN|nr:hypothetical protein [Tsukamurella spumae]NKY18855.1 hypothetical protein [Tsukamurella spumae]